MRLIVARLVDRTGGNLRRRTTVQYIVAVPARRYSESADTVSRLDFTATAEDPAEGDWIREIRWQGRRRIVAHDPLTAARQVAERQTLLAELLAQGEDWVKKRDRQD